MSNITGNPIISSVDLYSSSTTPDSNFELGQLIFAKNGKAFRYVLAGATTGYDSKIDLRYLFFRGLNLIGATKEHVVD